MTIAGLLAMGVRLAAVTVKIPRPALVLTTGTFTVVMGKLPCVDGAKGGQMYVDIEPVNTTETQL